MSETRNIPFARPSIDDADRAAVLRVLDGHVLTHGPEGKAFEQEFGGFIGDGASCVTVSSCMAALHLACISLVEPGDEVIVPALTHVATAHAVEWIGARPVFVDCELATGNMAPSAVEAAVTERTSAILLVHFAGIPCDMTGILDIASRHDLKVIEDCALAVGTRFKGTHAGLLGDAGCFSFYPVKHLTTAEGGMFVSRHGDVAEAVARVRAFGVRRTGAGSARYDVPVLGLNYRMSELQAALGRSQLSRAEAFLEQRHRNFAALKRELEPVAGVRVLDVRTAEAVSSHYCLSVVLEGTLGERRDDVIERLKTAGIGTSVYYPQPVPRMEYYRRKYGWDPSAFPAACEVSDRSVALPVGPHVSADDACFMGRTLGRIVEEMS